MAELNPYLKQVVPSVRPGVSFNPGQRALQTGGSGGGGGYGSARGGMDLRYALDDFAQWDTDQNQFRQDNPNEALGPQKTQEQIDRQYEKDLEAYQHDMKQWGEASLLDPENAGPRPAAPMRETIPDNTRPENYRSKAESQIEDIIIARDLNRKEAEEFRKVMLQTVTRNETNWEAAQRVHNAQRLIADAETMEAKYISEYGAAGYDMAIEMWETEFLDKGLIPHTGGEGQIGFTDIVNSIKTRQDVHILEKIFTNDPAYRDLDPSEKREKMMGSYDTYLKELAQNGKYEGIKTKEEFEMHVENIYAQEIRDRETAEADEAFKTNERLDVHEANYWDAVYNGTTDDLSALRQQIIADEFTDQYHNPTFRPLLNMIDAATRPNREATPEDWIRAEQIVTPLLAEKKDAMTILSALAEANLPGNIFQDYMKKYGRPSEVTNSFWETVHSTADRLTGIDEKGYPALAQNFYQNISRQMLDGTFDINNMAPEEIETAVNNFLALAEKDTVKRLTDLENSSDWFLADPKGRIVQNMGLFTANDDEARAISQAFASMDFRVDPNGMVNPELSDLITPGTFDDLRAYDFDRMITRMDADGNSMVILPLKDGAQIFEDGTYTPVRAYRVIVDPSTENGARYELVGGIDDKLYAGYNENGLQFGSIATTGEFLAAEDMDGGFGYSMTGDKYDVMAEYDLNYVYPDDLDKFMYEQMTDQASEGGDLLRRKLEAIGAQPRTGQFVTNQEPPVDQRDQQDKFKMNEATALISSRSNVSNFSSDEISTVQEARDIAESDHKTYQSLEASLIELERQKRSFDAQMETYGQPGAYVDTEQSGMYEKRMAEIQAELDALEEKNSNAVKFLERYNKTFVDAPSSGNVPDSDYNYYRGF